VTASDFFTEGTDHGNDLVEGPEFPVALLSSRSASGRECPVSGSLLGVLC
jgi:hypothetical protein